MKSGSVKALAGAEAEGLADQTLGSLLGGVKEKKSKKSSDEKNKNEDKKEKKDKKEEKKEKATKKRKKRKEGWLVKEGGVYRNWNRRWFVLADEVVYYFKDAQPHTPLSGVIRLQVPIIILLLLSQKHILCFICISFLCIIWIYFSNFIYLFIADVAVVRRRTRR
jgi:cellulose synthase/poly-beta-1,6-N-acetylglucosamine synthase-like glycosyltransferase